MGLFSSIFGQEPEVPDTISAQDKWNWAMGIGKAYGTDNPDADRLIATHRDAQSNKEQS